MKTPIRRFVPVLGFGVWMALALVSSASAKDLSSVAKKLAKGMVKLQNKYVAVLPFTYAHDEVSSGSTLVAERLTTELVSRQVAVVERSQLEKVVGEIKLEMSGAVDAVSAQKLGKMLGVDAVVTGTLNDFDNRETEVNARLIRTETGEILAADTVIIQKQWMDFPRKVFVDSHPPSSPSDPNYRGTMSALIPVHFGANGPGDPGKGSGSSRQSSHGNSANSMPTYSSGSSGSRSVYSPAPYSPPPYSPPPYVPAPSRSR